MALPWPAVLRPTDFGFWLENQSRSGGVALNGSEQLVVSGAARWRASGVFSIFSKAQVFAARTVFADGRAAELLVPAFEGHRANWPVDIYGRTLSPRAVRRRTLDGTVYADAVIPAVSEIIANAAGRVEVGATSMTILVSQGTALTAGQIFGLGERAYLIRSIAAIVGNAYTVTFSPRLRVTILSGRSVLLDSPVCKMRLTTDDGGLKALSLLRFGDLPFEAVEIL